MLLNFQGLGPIINYLGGGAIMRKKPKEDYKNAVALLNEKPKDKGPQKTRTTLYIDKDIYERFKKLCKNRDKSTSGVVEKMMTDMLGMLKSKE